MKIIILALANNSFSYQIIGTMLKPQVTMKNDTCIFLLVVMAYLHSHPIPVVASCDWNLNLTLCSVKSST